MREPTPPPASPSVVVLTPDELDRRIAEAARAAVLDALPEALRRATMPEVLTPEQVAEHYGLTQRQQAYRREQGQLPYVQHGRSVLYRRADLDAFVEAGYVPARRSA